MKYTFHVTVECPDDQFEGCKPTHDQVADFIMHEMLFAGGCYFSGDKEDPPAWEFILYRYGITNVE